MNTKRNVMTSLKYGQVTLANSKTILLHVYNPLCKGLQIDESVKSSLRKDFTVGNNKSFTA